MFPQDFWHATITEIVLTIVNIVISTILRFSTKMPDTDRVTEFVILTEYNFILINRYIIEEKSTDIYTIFGKNTFKYSIIFYYIDSVYDFTICKYNITDFENF